MDSKLLLLARRTPINEAPLTFEFVIDTTVHAAIATDEMSTPVKQA